MAVAVSPPVRAILWAQWRSLWNFRAGEGIGGRVLAAALALAWYGLWAGLALVAAFLLHEPEPEALRTALPWILTGVFFYWQLAPVLTVSLGASLDLRKLLVYPITEGQLFLVEVLLRLTTGLEMLLVLAGIGAGLLRNPEIPVWGPLIAMPLYAAFNLLVAAGLRNLLERVLSHKHVREGLVFVIVLAAAVPQLIALAGPPEAVRRIITRSPPAVFPWTAAGRLATGEPWLAGAALLLLWIAGAWLFGSWQFHRSLRIDRSAVESAPPQPGPRAAVYEWFYRLPGAMLPDPLAAIVEKELRSLFRSPRFRLVFLMGFSFGFLIWIPLFRSSGQGLSENYAVVVSVYALLLLSEVIFWNMFGFDRSAVQLYLTIPVPLSRVVAGKNVAGLVLVVIEVTVVLLVCLLLRVPLPLLKVVEVYAVTLTLCLYLFTVGNLSSVYHPRPVNPEQSWGRASSGRFQMVLLLLYPVLSAPVLLAYGARFAFESQAAFFGVLAVAGLVGAISYWVALESAVQAAGERREALIEKLGQAAGPVITQ